MRIYDRLVCITRYKHRRILILLHRYMYVCGLEIDINTLLFTHEQKRNYL